MKKTICGIVMIFILANFSYAYSDITKSYWAYDAINELSSREILSGYPDGSFKPDNNITIAEFLSVFMKMLAPDADTSSVSNYWADWAIELSKSKNVLQIEDYSFFNPNEDITRKEICLMIYRSLDGVNTIDITKLKNKKVFLDINTENSEEYIITALLSHIGILSGYPDGTVKLNNTCTRAELSVFIQNYLRCRCKLVSTIKDNEFIAYENDIATVNEKDLPSELKKWKYSDDIPYVTTKINTISMFPFNEPSDKYKELFYEISCSNEIYLKYRKKFGENNYVIAIEFETTNNTYESDIYAGYEFLRLDFIDNDIDIIDAFDTDEIKRQLSGDANIGVLVRPSETQNTSAFYVVNKLPDTGIRFDRDITDLNKEPSFHSLIVKIEGR